MDKTEADEMAPRLLKYSELGLRRLAMSFASSRSVRASLKKVLRHCKSLPSGDFLAGELRAAFREGKKQQHQHHHHHHHQQIAADLALLVESMQTRKELIDLWAGEKITQDQRISQSAHRVGLAMPERYRADAGAGAEAGGDGKK